MQQQKSGKMPDYELEAELGGRVAGIDEVGTGPICGPVMSCAVVFMNGIPEALKSLLGDSKKLSEKKRSVAYAALIEAKKSGQVDIGIGAASSVEIGRINILRATHLAMQRAVMRLSILPDVALVDGNRTPPMPCRSVCVVKGDSKSFSIAAASIIAKVTRDRAMARLGIRWPGYGLEVHAGYPTVAHLAALAYLGPSPHHRRGFGPVDRALAVQVCPVG
jgi:ribonuclease HII